MNRSVWYLPLLVLACRQLVGQTVRGGFIVTLGKDTVVIEQYRRTRTTITGDILVRGAFVVHRHYSGVLNSDGTMARFDMTDPNARDPDAPVVHEIAVFGDTTVVDRQSDTLHGRLKVATRGGALPYLFGSYAMEELYVQRAMVAPTDTVATVQLGSGVITPLIVKHPTKNTFTMGFPDWPSDVVTVDRRGLIQTVDATRTYFPYRAQRVSGLVWSVVAPAFLREPPLSPSDSVRATVDGIVIEIDYSRPRMRGRRVFGPDSAVPPTIVSWGQVWRTGANFATRFTTSGDLTVGGQTIPSGTYTLWTVPQVNAWKLIFNKQTKAPCATPAECVDPERPKLWGIDYSPDSDLVRVDMQVESLPQPVEQLVIRLEPQGDSAILAVEWENTRASVSLAKNP
jgi:hypothetical protein